jgi:hypothetical protein
MKRKEFYNSVLTKESALALLVRIYGISYKQANDYLKSLNGKYTISNIMYPDIQKGKLVHKRKDNK